MRILLAILLLLPSLCWASITTISVKEKAGVSTASYPLTFGHVFKQGDVPAGKRAVLKSGGVAVATQQCDIKTTYSDGSVRFAVISAIVPTTANQTASYTLDLADVVTNTGLTKQQILDTNLQGNMALTGLSDSGYSGDATADLRTAITAQTTLRYWLQGPACTEILVDSRINNSLNATWEVRVYPGTPYIRVSHAVENVESNYRGNVGYTVNIGQGIGSAPSVYGPKTVTHTKNSRWRKVLWVGTAPPEVEIHYDTPYLISTGHVMPYDTSLTVSESAIASMASSWAAVDTDIFGRTYTGGSWMAGLAHMRFPDTGGRSEIGILPKWAAMYLLTWDNRLRTITLGHGELMANAPVHWREHDAAKSFKGRVINIDDRPKVRNDGETNAVSASYDPLPAAIGDTTITPWEIDRSHQGSFNYIPYMVTGEYFYLQEMYYWAGYDLSACHWDTSWGRNLSNGWIQDQIRGVAWAMRNISDAAVMATDGDPEKTYFTTKIGNNITFRTNTVTQYPLRHMSNNDGAPAGVDASVTYTTSPWMEDYNFLAWTHMQQLGFNTAPVLTEYSKFIIGRFSNPVFNWYNGATYRFPTVTTGGQVSTWAQASSLFTTQPASFDALVNAYSYPYIAKAALSQATGYTGGSTAYTWLSGNITAATNPTVAEDPTWALLPTGYVAPPAAPATHSLGSFAICGSLQ